MSLVFLGNPALRRMSKKVADVRAPAIAQLLTNMEAQVRQEDGVGIAAPQLGHNLRMFLMLKDAPLSDDDLPHEDDTVRFEYQAVINPEIVETSKATMKDFEGCLSIPGYMGVVRRAREIRVQFNDAEGRTHQKTLRDFPARIFQHELDHLNGVLYLDRLEKDTLIHNEEFRRLDRAEIAKLLRD
ncbi:hypothetical protein Poli38472_012505 [Pythium oligandrum]|uniref:Peptide deformylase n=1 Tax=Pythium oligandrum TaxID=41045 RepID=A0A8K1CDB4_PYTOL|nr:hypothetical protein Poli38472_012505 [Pythium oligandrum]|eukprot:TMW61314.1 hypothetical protein Poli38472_012505 [Pythium oligandrum]